MVALCDEVWAVAGGWVVGSGVVWIEGKGTVVTGDRRKETGTMWCSGHPTQCPEPQEGYLPV